MDLLLSYRGMFKEQPFSKLLEAYYPGMSANMVRCEALGYPWKSKPFVKEKNGEIVSHVGFLEYPMLIEGRWFKAGALHAICTKETHRGQGLASALIQDVLKWAEPHSELVILFTEIPRFYEKLGFRLIQEHRFRLPCPQKKGSQILRPMVFPQDNDLFLRLFLKQAPISHRVWVQDDGTIASFNALFATFPTYWSLHYSPSIDAIISYFLKDKEIHLLDVIASKIPSLEVVLDHLPAAEEIYFYFSPDRLTKEAVSESFLYDKGHLMVHGNWHTSQPFMIVPLSRC